ncbi:hypothetical protein E4T38_02674 [Aureobasidium subglaciale]|nr:hypothetical protein E4T38_02674 [Aureobasidium subglaciale]KAI5227653.1 hypothetical protein E4T40_02501 [Aureobasidium subglaciale]KAI5230984.1 hypothetical protein E4T41_02673 [Aureobasidium subglaciale]KAI5265246.1 hypothetical protein E4T46_02451 [Aureobasidium subglaciale]
MPGRITFLLLALTLLLTACRAAIVEKHFNLTWVNANPDGLQERKVIGVNNAWPLPVLDVNKGDRLIVHVYNDLETTTSSIHWHGLFQNSTNEMDGPSMFTQCPIVPGESFTYDFTVDQSGTYWYHCHTDNCYPDGERQALVVHDSDAWFADQYKEEFAVTVSDWYHNMVEDITFLDLSNPTGAEPIPDSFLFNDTINTKISVEPNTTYLLRIINTGAFVAQYFYIEDHNFTIVEVDGVFTEPEEASVLYVAVAQRYSVLFTTKESTARNYGLVTIADQVLLDGIPDTLVLNQTNWLQYNPSASFDAVNVTLNIVDENPGFDDYSLVPYDKEPLFENPTKVINLTISMGILDNGKPYAFFNDQTYTRPKVPSLYTALTAGEEATNEAVYGEYTNSFVLNHLEVVEVVLTNNDGGSHPFHYHGHNFQVVSRFPSYGEDFYSLSDDVSPSAFDPNNHTAFPTYPIRRDVVVVPPMGNVVLRFIADNPGVWAFHCHIDWHMRQGLAATFIEAPLEMQKRISVPDDHFAACKAAGISYEGNAAANTKDYLDLKGQNKPARPVPAGFEARGIVALVFSCIAALVGLAAIAWYGMAPLSSSEQEAAERKVAASIVQTHDEQ